MGGEASFAGGDGINAIPGPTVWGGEQEEKRVADDDVPMGHAGFGEAGLDGEGGGGVAGVERALDGGGVAIGEGQMRVQVAAAFLLGPVAFGGHEGLQGAVVGAEVVIGFGEVFDHDFPVEIAFPILLADDDHLLRLPGGEEVVQLG